MGDELVSAGDVLVEVAYCHKAKRHEEVCLATHSQFADWAKQQIELGRVILTMTVAQYADILESEA